MAICRHDGDDFSVGNTRPSDQQVLGTVDPEIAREDGLYTEQREYSTVIFGMRPFVTLTRIKTAIRRGDVERTAKLLPAFLEKTIDIPEYRDQVWHMALARSLFQPADTASKMIKLCLDSGFDPNGPYPTSNGKTTTVASLAVMYHADLEDVPEGLSRELSWHYAADIRDWNITPGAAPRIGYHPEVLTLLLTRGADLSRGSLVNDWSSHKVSWDINKNNLANAFEYVSKVNRIPDLEQGLRCGQAEKSTAPPPHDFKQHVEAVSGDRRYRA